MDLEFLLGSLTDPNKRYDDWICLNEFSDLMSSLKALDYLIPLTKKDVGTWKLTILCLHSALQGTAVCLLTKSDGSGALPEATERKLAAFYADNKNSLQDDEELEQILGKSRIEYLPGLLRRLGYPYPKDHVPPSKNCDITLHYLVKLHNWRSLFTHFPPLHWAAPEQEFVFMAQTVASVIRQQLTSNTWQRRPLITEDELLPVLDRIDKHLAAHTATPQQLG